VRGFLEQLRRADAPEALALDFISHIHPHTKHVIPAKAGTHNPSALVTLVALPRLEACVLWVLACARRWASFGHVQSSCVMISADSSAAIFCAS
jgi:hypothetical protein